MTITALKLTTRVLPGNRIEVVAPELPEGADVEVFVALPEASANGHTTKSENNSLSGREAPQRTNYISALDFLDSLPPSTLTAQDWERIEREIQEEKNSWER